MPRKIVGLVLAVLIVASLLAERSLVANVAVGTQHVVKPGETLGAIAAQYGVTVEQLAAENSLADPDRVVEGQTLRIPASAPAATTANTPPPSGGSATASQPPSTAPPAQRAAVEYVVQPGDTLSGIAKALGVSMKVLLEANPLADPDRLTIGQKLSVPAAAATIPPGTSQGTSQTAAQPAPPATTQANSPAAGQSTAQQAQTAAADAGALLDKFAQQYGLDKNLVRALAWAETNGRPRTLEPPGGIGYLRVTDPTFQYIQDALVKRQLDRANLSDNVEAGVAYLASMLKWGGDEPKGLAGFIQGPGSVTTNGVRPATDEQVKRVLALRDRVAQGTTPPSAPRTSSAPAPTTAQPAQTNATTAPAPSRVGAAQSPAAAPAPAVPQASMARPATARAPAAGGLGAGTGSTATRSVPAELTASLTARVIGAARSVAGAQPRIGISGRNLVSGQRIAIASDQTFPAASVDKLALLVEAYRQAQTGSRTLNEEQQADLRAMIVMSDNEAANRLLELFGPRAVNASLQALGLAGTRLINPFGSAPPGGQAGNVTSAGDMTRLMELMATEQLVSAPASREMRGLLLQAQDASKLRRGIPTDARLAHKSGWYDGVANDVGIVTQGSSSYVIAVFTDGIADAEVANQTIAAVAKVVHEAWGPN